jgi:hypothetical protein
MNSTDQFQPRGPSEKIQFNLNVKTTEIRKKS